MVIGSYMVCPKVEFTKVAINCNWFYYSIFGKNKIINNEKEFDCTNDINIDK